ncbi:MAG: NfeD family protein [Clostridiales bacterium]|jgi:membrane-bound serine protease (ClpP class)|nr:NfeD family protein [Clostridiales bacterium]
MIAVIVALLILSLLFCFAEMLMPGFGICGIIGIVLLAVASAFTVAYTPFGLFLVAFEILGVTGGSLLALRFIFKKQLAGKFVLSETLSNGQSDIDDLSYLLGKIGLAKTTLKPYGFAEFDGVQFEVSSDGPLIPQKSKIKVIGITKSKVIVKQLPENFN